MGEFYRLLMTLRLALLVVAVLLSWQGIPQAADESAEGVEMILIPAGKFLMGSTDEQVEEAWKECRKKYPDCGRQWFEAEPPQHVVLLDAYYIDKTEVTNRAYRACVDSGECSPPKRKVLFDDPEYDEFPVVFIDWYQADTYCRWRGGRLPTEAEWEKAAGGVDGMRFPWGDEFMTDKRAAFRVSKLQPVGQYEKGASPYGVLDMAGNVWEWVQDWFSPTYYKDSPYVNPQGPETGDRKVYRGGSWRSDLTIYIRTTHRNHYVPLFNDIFTGVRCAKDSPSSVKGRVTEDGVRDPAN